MIDLKKKEGESQNALIFRFNKKVKQSGIMKELRKRRFRDRPVSKNKRRSSALYREKKKNELKEQVKYGAEPRGKNSR